MTAVTMPPGSRFVQQGESQLIHAKNNSQAISRLHRICHHGKISVIIHIGREPSFRATNTFEYTHE